MYWGPEPVVDLGYPDDVAKTYEATLREGAIGDVCTVLNGALLAEVWPELVLPVPVRAAWEHRFPAHLRR
ncbi:hypothetical protein Q7F20_12645 [Curtobacterium sp. A7_M15]|uniref:hypothetical protein n=1 Tax=Curtobacterium sp. A7_M15 TaxID=3065241 RepID=UPI002737CF0F|nr:hypothetical protein [Curtobacterium sp. A7_M15]MDP4334220.1 hypothetical protein [Curtobacterium sp. A7_M15]